jgi:hypothetical protein
MAVAASQFGKLVILPTQFEGVSEFCAFVIGQSNEAMKK